MPISKREQSASQATIGWNSHGVVWFSLTLFGSVSLAAACASKGDDSGAPEQLEVASGAGTGGDIGSSGSGGSGAGSAGTGGGAGSGDYTGSGGGDSYPESPAYVDVPCPSSFDDPEGPIVAIPSSAYASALPSLSADGSSVVGVLYEGSENGPDRGRARGYRWTRRDGLRILPDDPTGLPAAVNADGSIIVGAASASDGSTSFAARWSSGGAELLPALDGATGGGATAVSADGSVIVGYQAFEFEEVPVRWTSAGVERLDQPFTVSGDGPLATLAVRALGVSADGTIAVGREQSRASPSLRWVGAAPAELLRLDGNRGNEAFAISADGRVVVGTTVLNQGGDRFIRWEEGVATVLDALSSDTLATAQALSGDGSLVGGYDVSLLPDSTGSATLWDAVHGMRRLDQVLRATGADLASWQLSEVTSISNDGKLLVGQGMCGSRRQSFLVHLP